MSDPSHPNRIIRKKKIPGFLALGKTMVEELIDKGEIEVFALTEGGRAKGAYEQNLVAYLERRRKASAAKAATSTTPPPEPPRPKRRRLKEPETGRGWSHPACADAVLAVIDAVGGDPNSNDHHPCPVCGGNSMSIKNGYKVPVVVYCHKCGREGGGAIVDKLRGMNVWPTTAKLDNVDAATFADQQQRSALERHKYAVAIWNDLRRSGGRNRSRLLRPYLKGRGIKRMPSTALVTLPIEYEGSCFASHDPGMVLPVRDREGKLQAIQVTWLSPDMKRQRKNEPQRQSYGLLKGNFVALTDMDFTNPPATLLIGEGAETVLTAMQVTGLPGIATAGAGMMNALDPPCCGEYILLADTDDAGQQSVKTLARKLRQQIPSCVVRIATPVKPEGAKSGYDWNDAAMDGVDPEKMKAAIVGAPIFDTGDDDRYAACIAALAALQSRAYDAKRQAIKEEFGVRVATIDKDVEKYRTETKLEQAKPTAPDIEKLAVSAKEIIDCQDVVSRFVEECSEVIAGEVKLLKLLYLSGTSRLFPKAMHVALKGPSAGGKSEARRRVLEYFPPRRYLPSLR